MHERVKEIIIITFFGKSNSSAKSHQTFVKIVPWFSHFFPWETSFPKSIYKVPGKKDAEAYSECIQTSKTELFVEIVNDF